MTIQLDTDFVSRCLDFSYKKHQGVASKCLHQNSYAKFFEPHFVYVVAVQSTENKIFAGIGQHLILMTAKFCIFVYVYVLFKECPVPDRVQCLKSDCKLF